MVEPHNLIFVARQQSFSSLLPPNPTAPQGASAFGSNSITIVFHQLIGPRFRIHIGV